MPMPHQPAIYELNALVLQTVLTANVWSAVVVDRHAVMVGNLSATLGFSLEPEPPENSHEKRHDQDDPDRGLHFFNILTTNVATAMRNRMPRIGNQPISAPTPPSANVATGMARNESAR